MSIYQNISGLLASIKGMPGPYGSEAAASAAGIPVRGLWEDVSGFLRRRTSFSATVGGDAAKLNAQLAFLGTLGGGKLPLDAKQYDIEVPLSVPNNVTIEGQGYGTVLKAVAALNTPMIVNTDTSGTGTGIGIVNLRIDGSRATQTQATEGDGIKLTKVTKLKLRDLWVHDCLGHAIHLSQVGSTIEAQSIQNVEIWNIGDSPTATWGSAFAITNGTNIHYVNCRARDVAKAGFRLSGTGLQLIGCSAQRCGNGGIVPVSGECFNLTVLGGYFADNGSVYITAGIRMVAVTGATITGAHFVGNGGSGIEVLNGSKDIIITGNIVTNNAQTPGTTNTSILYLSAISGGTFNLGNTVTQGAASATISAISAGLFAGVVRARLTGITGGTFTTGSVTNTTTGATATVDEVISTSPESRCGIAVYDEGTACNRVIINGNIITDTQGSPTHTYGIDVSGNAQNVVLGDNIISGFVTQALRMVASTQLNWAPGLILGATLPYRDLADRTITGTLTETALSSIQIQASELGRNGAFELYAAGVITGTAGTKSLIVNFGTAQVITIPVPQAFAGDYEIRALGHAQPNNAASRYNVICLLNGQTVFSDQVASSTTLWTSAQFIRTRGQLGNTADQIQQKMFEVRRVR